MDTLRLREVAALGRVRRVRESLLEACGTCRDRDSALRRVLMCRCPVALAGRMLVRVERHGADPEAMPAGERASLEFQERALSATLPSFDPDAVARAQEHMVSLGHEPCPVEGCLTCRAARLVRSLATSAVVG